MAGGQYWQISGTQQEESGWHLLITQDSLLGGFVFGALPVIFIHRQRWNPVQGGVGSMDVRRGSSLAHLPLACLPPPQPSVQVYLTQGLSGSKAQGLGLESEFLALFPAVASLVAVGTLAGRPYPCQVWYIVSLYQTA